LNEAARSRPSAVMSRHSTSARNFGSAHVAFASRIGLVSFDVEVTTVSSFVDAAHLPGELDCRPLFRPLTPEVAGSSPFFARPFGSEMGARENAPQAAFLSLRVTMKSSEGEGETRESGPATDDPPT
jgi:hypothetical protein